MNTLINQGMEISDDDDIVFVCLSFRRLLENRCWSSVQMSILR